MQNYDLNPNKKSHYQAKNISTTDAAVQFLGSITGPGYNAKSKCFSLQVTWNVEPSCKRMDINSTINGAESNTFNEHSAHGVRELVTNKKLLVTNNW